MTWPWDTLPKRIDILTQVDGVQFDSCWERRIDVEIGGQRVPFLSADDLLTNKKASGRPQDIADVAVLQEQLGDAQGLRSHPRR